MHPECFSKHQRLSDWPECWIEIYCPCGRSTAMLAKMMRERYGDLPFTGVIRQLRCERCRRAPGPVYLRAGLVRTFCHGGEPDWAVELVPPPV